jgi:hypothetical protein
VRAALPLLAEDDHRDRKGTRCGAHAHELVPPPAYRLRYSKAIFRLPEPEALNYALACGFAASCSVAAEEEVPPAAARSRPNSGSAERHAAHLPRASACRERSGRSPRRARRFSAGPTNGPRSGAAALLDSARAAAPLVCQICARLQLTLARGAPSTTVRPRFSVRRLRRRRAGANYETLAAA